MTYLMPIDEIRQLYEEERLTLSQISEIFGCSIYIIRRKLITAGVQIRRQGTRKSDLEKHSEELVARYNGGEPVNGLAKEFGCSGHLLRRLLVELGVKIRSHGWRRNDNKRWDSDMRRELRIAYSKLGSYDLAGRRFGITRQRVHQILKNYKSPAARIKTG